MRHDCTDAPSESDHQGRHPSRNGIAKNRPRNDHAGSNDCTAAYGDAMQNNRPGPNPHVILNPDAQIVHGTFFRIGNLIHETAHNVAAVVTSSCGYFGSEHDMVADSCIGARRYRQRSHAQIDVITYEDAVECMRSVGVKPKIATRRAKEPS